MSSKEQFINVMSPIIEDAGQIALFFRSIRNRPDISDQDFEDTLRRQLIGWSMTKIREASLLNSESSQDVSNAQE